MANTVHIDSKKLKLLREQNILSQEGLEQACRQTQGCSISMATIKRAELGHPISRRSATKLANYFSLTLNELIIEPSGEALPPPVASPNTTESIILCFHSTHTHQLGKIAERALYFEPYMLQRANNTITVAFPYQPHSLCALILQSTLLKLCKSYTGYRALLSLETLTQPTLYQWQISEPQYQRLADIADKVPENVIVVSQDIYKQSYSILSYQSCASVNNYQELLQRKEPIFSYGESTAIKNNSAHLTELYGNDSELIR